MIDFWNFKRIDYYDDELDEAIEILRPLTNRVYIHDPEERIRLQPHELFWSLSKYQSFSGNSSLFWRAGFFKQDENPHIKCNWERC